MFWRDTCPDAGAERVCWSTGQLGVRPINRLPRPQWERTCSSYEYTWQSQLSVVSGPRNQTFLKENQRLGPASAGLFLVNSCCKTVPPKTAEFQGFPSATGNSVQHRCNTPLAGCSRCVQTDPLSPATTWRLGHGVVCYIGVWRDRCRWSVTEGAVRSDGIVMLAPLFDERPCLILRVEDFTIQQFVF